MERVWEPACLVNESTLDVTTFGLGTWKALGLKPSTLKFDAATKGDNRDKNKVPIVTLDIVEVDMLCFRNFGGARCLHSDEKKKREENAGSRSSYALNLDL